MRWRAMIFVVVAASLACAKAGDEAKGAKRSPASPPTEPASTDSVADIPVTVHSKKVAPLTGRTLAERTPEFSSGEEHRAWKLTTILAKYLGQGDAIVVVGKGGVRVTYQQPASAEELQPVLYLTRRGELSSTMVDPKDPFPGFHGRGGMLSRPGDPSLRVSPLLGLEVVGAREQGGMAASGDALASARAALVSLDITVDGAVVDSGELLKELPTVKSSSEHTMNRPVWSLRDLASVVAGPSARVKVVVSKEGEKRTISRQNWKDTKRVPILRGNRRGMLKLHWLSASGEVGRTELRDISGLELVR